MGKLAFHFEPAVWLGLVRAIMPALVVFDVIHWTTDQMAQFFVATEVLLTFIQRSFVTPNANLLPSTVQKAQVDPPA